MEYYKPKLDDATAKLWDEKIKSRTTADHFAPSACAFQIGYPADEDAMDGSNATGWWKLADPIKDWGDALIRKIKRPTQEIGLLWVCAKSGKSYNAKWDLTKPAPAAARKGG